MFFCIELPVEPQWSNPRENIGEPVDYQPYKYRKPVNMQFKADTAPEVSPHHSPICSPISSPITSPVGTSKFLLSSTSTFKYKYFNLRYWLIRIDDYEI